MFRLCRTRVSQSNSRGETTMNKYWLTIELNIKQLACLSLKNIFALYSCKVIFVVTLDKAIYALIQDS